MLIFPGVSITLRQYSLPRIFFFILMSYCIFCMIVERICCEKIDAHIKCSIGYQRQITKSPLQKFNTLNFNSIYTISTLISLSFAKIPRSLQFYGVKSNLFNIYCPHSIFYCRVPIEFCIIHVDFPTPTTTRLCVVYVFVHV